MIVEVERLKSASPLPVTSRRLSCSDSRSGEFSIFGEPESWDFSRAKFSQQNIKTLNMAKRTAEEAELDMHVTRRDWIKSQRRQGILLGTKKECKATVLAQAKALGLVADLSKKRKMNPALNKLRQALLCDKKAVYFYGHKDPSKPYHVFSNFARVNIVVSNAELMRITQECLPHVHWGIEAAESEAEFHSSEQIFMLLKALCMKDGKSAQAIANSTTPAKAKSLGRKVSPWNQELWETLGFGCMLASLRVKFKDPTARATLLGTGTRVLAEAAPRDCKWGIGIGGTKAKEGAQWRGKNLLGEALCIVRGEIVALT